MGLNAKAKKKMIQLDADTLSRIMQNYTGTEGAHFGFIAFETGQRQFLFGGRTNLLGFCLGEAMARMVTMTPGLTPEFIDSVAATAKEILKNAETLKGDLPQ